MSTNPERKKATPLSVSQLLDYININFQDYFKSIYFEAEISSMKISGGHCYFTLKDLNGDEQINAIQWNCAKNFATYGEQSHFNPNDIKVGARIEVLGELTVYKRSGSMQILINRLRLSGGVGEQLIRIEKLRQLIISNNWHSAHYKKPIPHYPKTIGIVTSPNASGLQDMLKVFEHDAPDINIIVYNTVVQGPTSANSIVTSIQTANAHKQVDLLIVGRGGGAFEDLISFSDEKVILAIVQSELPIISAVGHETDNPLSDLVADYHCVTPTAAAKYVCDPRVKLKQVINYNRDRLEHNLRQSFILKYNEFENIKQRLSYCDPSVFIENQFNELQNLYKKMHVCLQHNIENQHNGLLLVKEKLANIVNSNLSNKLYTYQILSKTLEQYNPSKILNDIEQKIVFYQNSMKQAFVTQINKRQDLLVSHQYQLKTLALSNFKQVDYNFRNLKQNFDNNKKVIINKIALNELNLQNLTDKLHSNFKYKLQYLLQNINNISNIFSSLDPTLPLTRGYTMILNNDNKPITDINNLKLNQNVNILMSNGQATAEIKDITCSKTTDHTSDQSNEKIEQIDKDQISILNAKSMFKQLKQTCEQLNNLIK